MLHDQRSKHREMVTHEMETEKTPVDAKGGTYHDVEAGPKVAPESSVSAADSAAITIRTTRYLRMNVSLGILAVIALVAALYLARAFFVPLLIGIIASYTLSPVVGWLKKCHVPRPAGAALVLAVLVGSLSWIAFSLSDGAAAMIDKFPEAASKLRQNLSDARSSGPTPLQNMQETAKQLEGAATDAGAKPGEHRKSVV